MSEASGVKQNTSRAMEHERVYDWLGAVESYVKALSFVPETDFSSFGQVRERIGYAFSAAALQAESVDEFRERMRQAVANYTRAKESYVKTNKSGKTAQMLRCDAMIAYSVHWLASEKNEKKRLLDECWKLTKQSLRAFEEAGEAWEYGKTYNQLSASAIFIFTREWDFQARGKAMEEAVEYGERAIKFLSGLKDSVELAKASAKTVVCLGVFAYYNQDVDKRDRLYQKGLGYWQKANELSQETAMIEMVYPVFGGHLFFGLEGTDEALEKHKKALEYVKKTGDKFLIGCALDWLTYHTAWSGRASEDPDKIVESAKTTVQFGQEAKDNFSKISYTCPRGDFVWIEGLDAAYDLVIASLETDLGKRRDLLAKALEESEDTMKPVEDSGYPEIAMYGHSMLAAVLLLLAEMETNAKEKKRLLERALEQINEGGRIGKQIEPYLYWNIGVGLNRIANIKSRLAELASDSETQKRLLKEAALDKEEAMRLALKELSFFEGKAGPTPLLFAPLGYAQYEHGNLLSHLYTLTGDKDHLRKAIKVFEDATESFKNSI
jgi:tetratricopeptide (TPR) repeat protein